VVEKAESSALLAALERAGPYVTSVVGDIERRCRVLLELAVQQLCC